MILAFKEQFKQKILDGSKIHTIRRDSSNMWNIGNKINFVTSNITENYECFLNGICLGIQSIIVDCDQSRILIDNTELTLDEMDLFAIRDGFKDISELFSFFENNYFNKERTTNYIFVGKIIHWTDFKY